MHSLNFLSKLKECVRIDQENERLIHLLGVTEPSIGKHKELLELWEEQKRLRKMISKRERNSVGEVAKIRDMYLKKTFSKVGSKVDIFQNSEFKVTDDVNNTTLDKSSLL